MDEKGVALVRQGIKSMRASGILVRTPKRISEREVATDHMRRQRLYALEKRLPIALQFVTFNADQNAMLKKASTLPANIQTMMTAFQDALKPEQQDDPRFAFRTAFVQKLGKASNSDVAVEFIKAGSEEAKALAQTIMIREVEKAQYTSTDIVKKMQKEGYPKFKVFDHTKLWQSLNAKKSGGLGRVGAYKNTWVWFESWVERVRAHCQENSARYK